MPRRLSIVRSIDGPAVRLGATIFPGRPCKISGSARINALNLQADLNKQKNEIEKIKAEYDKHEGTLTAKFTSDICETCYESRRLHVGPYTDKWILVPPVTSA